MTQKLTIEQLKFARSIGATHYDWDDKALRKDGYIHVENEWECGLSGNYYREYQAIQPIDFSPLDDPGPEYMPKVGGKCLCRWNSAPELYYKVKVIGTDGDSIIFRWLEGDNEGCLGENKQELFAGCMIFKPLPDPEQQRRDELLSKWRSQGLDNAHDTEKTLVSLGQVFDFIVGMEDE